MGADTELPPLLFTTRPDRPALRGASLWPRAVETAGGAKDPDAAGRYDWRSNFLGGNIAGVVTPFREIGLLDSSATSKQNKK